jgi:hypothetical protein
MTIAVLPGGRAHSLNSGADPSFEQAIVVTEVVALVAAAGYLVFMVVRLKAKR